MTLQSVPASNDGTDSDPYLRVDINLMTLSGPVRDTVGPTFDIISGMPIEGYQQLASDGFLGVQSQLAHRPSFEKADVYGMGITAAGMASGKCIQRKLRRWKKSGYQCASVVYGSGQESFEQACQEIEILLSASEQLRFPAYIELHRGSITEDIEKTLALIDRYPQLRFNADFSHYITAYRLDKTATPELFKRLDPILQRVRMIHGRLSNSSSMQLYDVQQGAAYDVYRYLLVRSFQHFLQQADKGDYIIFAPELLPRITGYAQYDYKLSGVIEIADRYPVALQLKRLAEECFYEAQSEKALTFPSSVIRQRSVITTVDELKALSEQKIQGPGFCRVELGTAFSDDEQKTALINAFIELQNKNEYILLETSRNTLTHTPEMTLKLIDQYPSLCLALNASEWVIGQEVRVEQLGRLYKKIESMRLNVVAIVASETTAENRLNEMEKVNWSNRLTPMYFMDALYSGFYQRLYRSFSELPLIKQPKG